MLCIVMYHLVREGISNMKNEILTRKHLALKLGVSEKTIFNYQLKGMPVFYIGTLPRYELDKVVLWFSKYTTRGGEQNG